MLILPKTAFEHFRGQPTHHRGQSYRPVRTGADREEKSNDNGKEKPSSERTVLICGCFPVHLQLVFPAFRCRFKFPVFPLLVGLLAPQARWLHPSADLSVAARCEVVPSTPSGLLSWCCSSHAGCRPSGHGSGALLLSFIFLHCHHSLTFGLVEWVTDE